MTKRHYAFAALLAGGLLFAPAIERACAAAQGDHLAYIGTYTNEKSKGIYAFWFDSKTGKMTPIGLAGEISNPSFLAVHPNRQFLYAVSEINTYDGQKSGSVSAFRIDRNTGTLTLLNTVAS